MSSAAALAAPSAWRCSACGEARSSATRPVRCGCCGTINSYAQIAAPPCRALRGVVAARAAGAPSVAPQARSAGEAAIVTSSASSAPPEPTTAPGEAPEGRAWAWATDVPPEHAERAVSGWAPWASVTGESPRRYLTLIHGKRGTGKTTLLLTLAARVAAASGRPAMYASGEQSAGELAAVAARIDLDAAALARVALVSTPELVEIEAIARDVRPALLVVDSLGTLTLGGRLASGRDVDTQRAAVERLRALLRETDTAGVLVLHMRADGAAAGGSLPQQLGDVVVSLAREGDHVRLAIDEKNRHGPDNVTALLARGKGGALVHVEDT